MLGLARPIRERAKHNDMLRRLPVPPAWASWVRAACEADPSVRICVARALSALASLSWMRILFLSREVVRATLDFDPADLS